MDFFKSVFQDDSDPPGTESESEEHENPEQSDPNEDDGGWSFGGLMKTLATRSETVIETYRRDLEEFGTGLKKEIEVAQGSLGTMGHAIDELGNTVLKGTAEIIAQGKEAILAAGNESDSSDNNSSKSSSRRDSFSSKPYSRFDAQVRAVQGDLNTYCEEPDDSDEYKKWEYGFSLDEKAEEIEKLLEENGEMKGLYKRAVPNLVDHETFWFRYFYKLHKLKQAEDLRANLVKRAISLEDEEELSWDIDDEEENTEKVHEVTKEASRLKLEGNDGMSSNGDVSKTVKDEVRTEVSNVGLKTDTDSKENQKDNEQVTESKPVLDAAPASDEIPIQNLSKPKAVAESKEQVPESKPVVAAPAPASNEIPIQNQSKPKAVAESKEQVPESKPVVAAPAPASNEIPIQNPSKPEAVAESKEAVAESKAVSSSTQEQSEEDLGWDEIEDMSSIDDKEINRSSGSPNVVAELRKRLSVAEEDEDLSWDIEEDEEEESSSSSKA